MSIAIGTCKIKITEITVAISAKNLQKFSTNTSTHIYPTHIQGDDIEEKDDLDKYSNNYHDTP